MGERRPIVCKRCREPIAPTTLGRSEYARSLPMCASCEDEALRRVRPSPYDRQQKGDNQR